MISEGGNQHLVGSDLPDRGMSALHKQLKEVKDGPFHFQLEHGILNSFLQFFFLERYLFKKIYFFLIYLRHTKLTQSQILTSWFSQKSHILTCIRSPDCGFSHLPSPHQAAVCLLRHSGNKTFSVFLTLNCLHGGYCLGPWAHLYNYLRRHHQRYFLNICDSKLTHLLTYALSEDFILLCFSN